MKRTTVVGTLLLLVACASTSRGEETPTFPEPTSQHQWLQQLVGQWDAEVHLFIEGQAPVVSKGTLHVRPVGAFWTVGEHQGQFLDQPFTGLQTLGYDPEKRKYVGTWVDSVSGYLWRHEGDLNESGSALTLSTEGPCPARPGQLSEFKEVIEVKSKDRQVFTSSIKNEEGEWTTNMKIIYHRKK
ncbi:MAG: DUF1579 domain-containing protein [Pirellulales bacterium]